MNDPKLSDNEEIVDCHLVPENEVITECASRADFKIRKCTILTEVLNLNPAFRILTIKSNRGEVIAVGSNILKYCPFCGECTADAINNAIEEEIALVETVV